MERKILGGKYVLLGQLGVRGTAIVYEGRAKSKGGSLAIEFYPDLKHNRDAAVRLVDLGHHLANLEHSNICEFLDAGLTSTGEPYLVRELPRGETLQERVHRMGGLRQEEAVDIIAQVLRALEYLHSKGILHRDISPRTILVVEGPQGPVAKLVDFGLAAFRVSDALGITGSEDISGYISPEELSGEVVDQRSDLFSVGVVLYESLVNAPALPPTKNVENLRASVTAFSAKLKECLPSMVLPVLGRVILRAVAPAKEDRFQNAREFLDAVAASEDTARENERIGVTDHTNEPEIAASFGQVQLGTQRAADVLMDDLEPFELDMAPDHAPASLPRTSHADKVSELRVMLEATKRELHDAQVEAERAREQSGEIRSELERLDRELESARPALRHVEELRLELEHKHAEVAALQEQLTAAAHARRVDDAVSHRDRERAAEHGIYMNVWFPQHPGPSPVLPLLRATELRVNLGRPMAVWLATIVSGVSREVDPMLFTVDHVDVAVLAGKADVSPFTRRLPLPPREDEIALFSIKPRVEGTLDMLVVLLVRGEPIHRCSVHAQVISSELSGAMA